MALIADGSSAWKVFVIIPCDFGRQAAKLRKYSYAGPLRSRRGRGIWEARRGGNPGNWRTASFRSLKLLGVWLWMVGR